MEDVFHIPRNLEDLVSMHVIVFLVLLVLSVRQTSTTASPIPVYEVTTSTVVKSRLKMLEIEGKKRSFARWGRWAPLYTVQTIGERICFKIRWCFFMRLSTSNWLCNCRKSFKIGVLDFVQASLNTINVQSTIHFTLKRMVFNDNSLFSRTLLPE